MSETFDAAVRALNDDPALRDRVMAAASSEERAQILREAGIDVPAATDVVSGFNNLAGVQGAGNTGTMTVACAVAAPSAAAACGG